MKRVSYLFYKKNKKNSSCSSPKSTAIEKQISSLREAILSLNIKTKRKDTIIGMIDTLRVFFHFFFFTNSNL